MPKKSLSSYIQEQINQGFSSETVKSHLMKYGYNQQMVEQAFNQLQPEIKHTFHISKTVLIAVAVISLGLIILGASLFFSSQAPKAPQQLLDVKVDIINNELIPDDKLNFNVQILSLGAIKRYDVELNYVVTDSSNKLITAKTETIALETRASITNNIRIPKDTSAGNYILKITAKYNNKIASASDTFRVSALTQDTCFNNIKDFDEEDVDCGNKCKPCPTCSDGIKNQGEESIDCGGPCRACERDCNDNNKCTRDYFEDRRCFNEPIQPCCGNLVCESSESSSSCSEDCAIETEDFTGMSSSEIIESIKETSKTDQDKASRLCAGLIQETFINMCFTKIAEATLSTRFCKNIINERTKDNCYSKLAELIGNNLICESIIKDPRRDSCYMNFVNIKDYSVCEKISNDFLKKSCEALKNS